MRIPVTISHGTNRGRYFTPRPHWQDIPVLDATHFDLLMRVAAELGFRSISCDDLAGWREGARVLPKRPIIFDLDHPNRCIHREVWPIMREYGYRANLFVNTAAMERAGDQRYMTWKNIEQLVADGWHIGAHMHHHISLAYLAREDPTGALIREEMDLCDGIIERRLGIRPLDFAFTTTTWSATAEREVSKRYRFARLWTISSHLDTDRGPVRYADLVEAAGADEPDGGPPMATRYITLASNPLRLPAMDFEHQIHEPQAFRRYLEASLDDLT